MGNAQSLPLSPGGRGVKIDGSYNGGRGNCAAGMSVLSSRNTGNTPTFSLYRNKSNNIVIKYAKSLIDEDTKSEFSNRNAYFTEKEQILDESVQNALNAEKPIILAKGWHPMIELEDCYIISYTLKEENK